MRDSESRPHVSLAVAESLDLPATHELLDRFGRCTNTLSISLRSLGFFVFRGRIAYLAPKVTPELLALHHRDRTSSTASSSGFRCMRGFRSPARWQGGRDWSD